MILKTTFKDGEIVFENLGDKFTLVSKQRCPAKFEEISKSYPADDCFAFICPLNMEGNIPIFTDFMYSIISEGGLEVMKIAINNL